MLMKLIKELISTISMFYALCNDFLLHYCELIYDNNEKMKKI